MSDTQPVPVAEPIAGELPHPAEAPQPAAASPIPGGTTIVEVQFEPGMARFTEIPHVMGIEVASPSEVEWEKRKWTGDHEVQEVLEHYGATGSAPGVSRALQVPLVHGEMAELESLELPVDGGDRYADFQRFKFPSVQAAANAAAALSGLSSVKTARQVTRAGAPAGLPMPTDPLIGLPENGVLPLLGQEPQWYLHRTNVLKAWELTRGANVVIADVDWGCRTTHQEFTNRLEYSCWINQPSTDIGGGPEARHGTAVLGIAGAAADERGICGYAPDAKLWMIRADPPDEDELATNSWADAIEHVRKLNSSGRRKVLLLEVETFDLHRNFEQFSTVAEAIRTAIESRIVVVVAAGNGSCPANLGDDGKTFTATGSILVAATRFDEDPFPREKDSNFGKDVVICAPGDRGHDVTCGILDDADYRDGFGGTSGAAAKVAGTAALMLAVNPTLSHQDVRDILVMSGEKIPTEPGKPIGVLLNTGKAVQMAKDKGPGAAGVSYASFPPPQPAGGGETEVLDEAA